MKTTFLTIFLTAVVSIWPIEDKRLDHVSPAIQDQSGIKHLGMIAAWNERAVEISYAEDQFFKFKGHRALSMMHLAMHDVLNSIEPRYERYGCTEEDSNANPTVAAAQAAFEVLLSQYPNREETLKEELAIWLDEVTNNESKQLSISLGRACAETIIKLREGDRWNTEGNYVFRDSVGSYQTTGSWDGYVHEPGFRSARPFVLKAPGQFRPLPPPTLESEVYAKAFNEVKMYGEAGSKARSEDQTGYAVWWMEFAEAAVNRLARQLARGEQLDLWNAAELFANINVALYDTYIAVWDAKYAYNHWRPVTAIRRADEDNNEQTKPETDWEPLRPTAPFPDYPSAHAAACSATFGVLEHIFETDFPFTMETKTAPEGMPTRSFSSFDEAARECADSRIQLGWHFRYAADEGLVLGRRVAEYILSNRLLRNSAKEGR